MNRLYINWFLISCLGFPTDCTTPNNEAAFCIDLQQCPKLMNTSTTNFFQKSLCGPRNGAPKVCCGKYTNYINQGM